MRRLVGFRPEQVTVLSGAGVSVEGPASLPTGWELTERVFGTYYPDGFLGRVLDRHLRLGWTERAMCGELAPARDRARPPRLETVLGVVSRVYGRAELDRVLADVASARPNRLHSFLAHHLAAGGAQLTANFDRCVEVAARREGLRWDAERLLHFHGVVGEPALGATLAQIQGGFPPALSERFLSILGSSPCTLVVGYSGSDFFDVDVAVAGLEPGALADRLIVWLNHGPHSPHEVDAVRGGGVPPVIAGLARAGAEVRILCAPTSAVLETLSTGWFARPLGGEVVRAVTNPVVGDIGVRRPAAAFGLSRELGLVDEVKRSLERPPAEVSAGELWMATSDFLWEQGKWNRLRRLWMNGRVPAELGRTIRLERIGACLWVQGRYVFAYLWLTWYRRRHTGEEMLTLAETEARVVEHMRRTELRPFARLRIHDVLNVLQMPDRTMGVDRFRRRGDVISSLRSVDDFVRADDDASISSEWFGQAGNLLAWITYTHRDLRDNYDETIADSLLRLRYRTLQFRYQVVGSRAGQVRVHLLPGAHRVFGTTEVVVGAFSVQYGWWQRLRIIGRHVLLRWLWKRAR